MIREEINYSINKKKMISEYIEDYKDIITII